MSEEQHKWVTDLVKRRIEDRNVEYELTGEWNTLIDQATALHNRAPLEENENNKQLRKESDQNILFLLRSDTYLHSKIEELQS